jgi:hypothetical protein
VSLARAVLVLCVVASVAAGEKTRLTEEQRAAVVRLVGEETWGSMPPWRQRMILDRYALFLEQGDRKREAIERIGLREFLLVQSRDEEKLPRPLADEARKLPPPLQPLAEKFAAVRLRQLHLDRSLARLPFEERRPMFLRLFPEPFEQDAAHAAYEDLRKREAWIVARALLEEMKRRGMTKEEKRALVRAAVRAEEEQIVERVRGELARLQGASPERARTFLDRFLASGLENLRFVTPRQRELIRYAIRPEECPLLDAGFLGPPPEDPEERRLWESDFRVLARLDLLSEAGFGREMVLHLASAGSPEDFLRGRPGPAAPARPPRPPPIRLPLGIAPPGDARKLRGRGCR